jgi:hypothetical protein
MRSDIAPICVLGMHRSGTSCLTGLLEDASVYLGQVSKKNPHNLKGNQENLRIMHLHNEVLEQNGGAWDCPPSGEVIWSDAQRETLRGILEDYRQHPLWAFKDPRTMFTLAGWQTELPDLRYIGTVRHPSAVAQSLAKRGSTTPAEGFALWLLYNRRLLAYQREYGFDVVCFDSPPPAYLESVEKAFGRLDLTAARTQFAFFEEALRTAVIAPEFAEVPADVLTLYETLKALSP